MNDPRPTLIHSLDLERCRIDRRPVKLFFCGGPIANVSEPQTSVRDYIIRHIWDKDPRFGDGIVLAEDIRDWLEFATYSDLITFEQDLAHLASAVILFVESPGSIAELGAFSLIPPIAKKLIVIVKQDHFESKSYIKLGPIKYLSHHFSADRILVYPWKETFSISSGSCRMTLDVSSIQDAADHIVQDIRDFQN